MTAIKGGEKNGIQCESSSCETCHISGERRGGDVLDGAID